MATGLRRRDVLAAGVVAAVMLGAAPRAAEADDDAKVALREQAARDLEKTHPGVKVKITWYEKNPLLPALKTALPAGQGPDVFYVEPDWTEYVAAGYLTPLDDLVDWKTIQPWA